MGMGEIFDNDTGIPDDDPLLTELGNQMRATHPLMGVMFEVAMEGSEDIRDMFRNLKEDNPNGYLKMLVNFVPSVAPVTGVQGEVHLHVHQSLGPTALDIQRD